VNVKLRFADVSFHYSGADQQSVLERISLDLPRGALAALIGANGIGKSTLLNLACGTLRPTSGDVFLDGSVVASLPPTSRARRIALVPQSLAIPFAFSVRELVGLGRTPHVRLLRGEREVDRLAIERAMQSVDVEHLANRNVLELSGGERQRVLLALALAQEPEVLLLDEPTANLDVAHQVAMLDLVRELNQATGLTVLAAIHDLNLAALGFERLIALADRQIIADGTPRAVLTNETIAAVYGSPVQVVRHPTEPVPLVALMRGRRSNASQNANPSESPAASVDDFHAPTVTTPKLAAIGETDFQEKR